MSIQPLLVVHYIAKIFESAGLPKGLLNVITTEISEIGDNFVEHPIPRAISITKLYKVENISEKLLEEI